MVWHAQPIADKVALGYRDDRKHGQHCVILLASWGVGGHGWACGRCALHSGCVGELCAKWSANFLIGGRSRQSWWPEQAARSGCGGGGGVSTSLVHALTEQSAACMQPGAPSALKMPDILASPQASAHGSWWPEQAARSGCGAGGAVSTSGDSEVAAPGKAGSSSAEGTSLGECTSTGPVSDGSGGSGSDESLVQVRGVAETSIPVHITQGMWDLPR